MSKKHKARVLRLESKAVGDKPRKDLNKPIPSDPQPSAQKVIAKDHITPTQLQSQTELGDISSVTPLQPSLHGDKGSDSKDAETPASKDCAQSNKTTSPSSSPKKPSPAQGSRPEKRRRLKRSKKKARLHEQATHKQLTGELGVTPVGQSSTDKVASLGDSSLKTDNQSVDKEMEIDNDTVLQPKEKKRKLKPSICASKDSSANMTIQPHPQNSTAQAQAQAQRTNTEHSAAMPMAKETKRQPFWNCTVCGCSWKQEKAWIGHLTSGQHMRRVRQMMQQSVPELFPYGRADVLSANDPFGWGTGAGVEEEEEEEEELEAENELEDDGGDDEDMDLGE
ncbi:hypothetical protein BGZ94_007444 [Podila epigama]|nr:hypothetical protein BGZ94_007444 [Podila epigama]